MTLEETDGGIRVDAYTARTLLSGLNLRYAFQVFEKHLPDDMCAENLPKENKVAKMPKMRESRRDLRARKKLEKLEKKAERINAKAQAAAQAINKDEN